MNCDKVTPVQKCECPIPNGGWCENHQIHKPQHFVYLCLTNPRYRRAWNECRGPLQDGSDPKQRVPGPGTHLKAILRRLGILETVNCNCAQRARQMDAWGPDGCEENMETILGWLKQEANSRRLPFIKPAAWGLVKMAIKKARKGAKHGN